MTWIVFFEELKTFTGAGFSTLPSPSGMTLPTGNKLCDEIRKKYNPGYLSQDKDLSYLSEFCPEVEFQDFLRSRFTANEYNPLHDVINKIAVKTGVTTNIDTYINNA